jgi:cytochrome c oxidase subunit II
MISSRALSLVAAISTFVPSLVMAEVAKPWQYTLMKPATEIASDAYDFHTLLMWIITAIVVFVLALLIIVMVRFNHKSNPKPSRTTHHTGLEVAWTIIPILILVVIAVPSFRLLREELVIPKPDVTVKAIGKQWYWSYEYPADQGGFTFDSLMLEDSKRTNPAEQPRLLAVDNELVVPVNKVIKVQVTAADVIHNFAMPSFGVRMDAIPGRLNETWFKAEREGMYYGQCSRLCGQNHAFMPIAVRVVSEAQYAAWLVEAKKKFAALDSANAHFAALVNQPAATK